MHPEVKVSQIRRSPSFSVNRLAGFGHSWGLASQPSWVLRPASWRLVCCFHPRCQSHPHWGLLAFPLGRTSATENTHSVQHNHNHNTQLFCMHTCHNQYPMSGQKQCMMHDSAYLHYRFVFKQIMYDAGVEVFNMLVFQYSTHFCLKRLWNSCKS